MLRDVCCVMFVACCALRMFAWRGDLRESCVWCCVQCCCVEGWVLRLFAFLLNNVGVVFILRAAFAWCGLRLRAFCVRYVVCLNVY